MTLKVGINGFGRIGRNIFRAANELKPDFEIVAVNDIGDAHTFAHLLKHDTALGTFGPAVSSTEDAIKVDGRSVKFLSQRDPGELQPTTSFRRRRARTARSRRCCRSWRASLPASPSGCRSWTFPSWT